MLRPAVLASSLVAAATLLAVRSPRADVPADAGLSAGDAHRRAVAAHVGSQAVTVGEIEDRLSPIPRFQLRLFGRTASDVVHTFFDQVVVRDVLLSLGAADRKLDHDVAVEQAVERTLSNATQRAIAGQVGPLALVPMAEVQGYYDANRARYDAPARVQIWRILCATKAEAQTVLDQAKKDGTATSFLQLSRDHNLDKATNLRGGNLGFVAESGASNEPGLTVDMAVVTAAQTVKDGELVSAPVPEGANFAVVWRRGSQPGVHRSLPEVEVQIRDTIVRQKRELAEKALIEKLRAEKVTELNVVALGDFDVAIDDGKIGTRMRPRARGVPTPTAKPQ